MQLSSEVTATPKQVYSQHEFLVEGSTGTLMAVCPPRLIGNGDLKVAVACLNGSIAMVALGVATPKAKTGPSTAGTVLDRWSSGATPLSLSWHPSELTVAVGRMDGLVELIPSTKRGQHRLAYHSEPVRAIEFTTDGSLLVTCSDGGSLAVWDLGGAQNTLVHACCKCPFKLDSRG
jgi:WD40 repeat protein